MNNLEDNDDEINSSPTGSETNYGHGGEDSFAPYEESHFQPTSDKYLDEEAEKTAKINGRAKRELQQLNQQQETEDLDSNNNSNESSDSNIDSINDNVTGDKNNVNHIDEGDDEPDNKKKQMISYYNNQLRGLQY